MKALFTFSLAILSAFAAAQDPATSYTNGVGTVPPFNGTNPPGQNSSFSVTIPNSYPSSTGTNPINPGSTSPTGSNSTYPVSPGVPQLLNFDLLFYQSDPSRTPRSPKQSDPVKTVDGSNGKYKSQHKTVSAKKNGFVTNRRTRGARPHRVSREKSRN